MKTFHNFNEDISQANDFCIAEALSQDIFSIELEEKEQQIELLESQVQSLDRQLSQWIRIAGYWQDKCHKLKNRID